jgi:hypothetical protein
LPLTLQPISTSTEAMKQRGPYAGFSNSFPDDPSFFPIGVWMQNPAYAAAFKRAGVNVYVGLWNGPTEKHLAELAAVGMKTICSQNDVGLRHLNDKTITGWMSFNDPDDAQPDGKGGHTPPISPSAVVERFHIIKAKDATRPVYLVFDQGAARDDYGGRGSRTKNSEDYAEYAKGADVLSYHIYPVNEWDPAVAGNLWHVASGAERLRKWTGDAKPVWAGIECTRREKNSPRKPTAAEVRAEVWMALIHGAKGIVYFCHSFDPEDEAALLNDAPMYEAVTAINQQVSSLAAVLNSSDVAEGVRVQSSDPAVPVAMMAKTFGGQTYIFAVSMRAAVTTATFSLPVSADVEVIGENRSLKLSGGKFSDRFEPYSVHLYRIPVQ